MCTPRWGGRWRSVWPSCLRPVTAWYGVLRAADHCPTVAPCDGRSAQPRASVPGGGDEHLDAVEVDARLDGRKGIQPVVARVRCPGEIEAHRMAGAEELGLRLLGYEGASLMRADGTESADLAIELEQHSLQATGGKLLDLPGGELGQFRDGDPRALVWLDGAGAARRLGEHLSKPLDADAGRPRCRDRGETAGEEVAAADPRLRPPWLVVRRLAQLPGEIVDECRRRSRAA